MESIIQRLRAKADTAPSNTLLKDTITLLVDLQRNPASGHLISWDALRQDFAQLRERGLWECSKENDDLLDALRDFLITSPDSDTPQRTASSPKSPPHPEEESQERFPVIVSPSHSFISKLISNPDPLVLPFELVDILNKAYFLHLLAADRSQVLPPGKSLLSVMSHAHTASEDGPKPTLRNKVEDLVHKAFWDEALETLSNPEPATQLVRLKLLYNDLHIALSSLLPPRHPVLVSLSSPPSPTSSPLESAVSLLRVLLSSLQERCAPVRDSEIESIRQNLDNPPLYSSRPAALARLVADTVKSILEISEVMKDDLSQFVLGRMTEQQLMSVVSKQAKTIERQVTIDIWRKDRVMQGWRLWLERLQAPFPSLGSASPLSCPLPTRVVPTTQSSQDDPEAWTSSLHATLTSIDQDNILPPIFFFSVPSLVKIQNDLQALVIVAVLHPLARSPLLAQGTTTNTTDPTFSERVWTLLQADIAGESDVGDTKLVNLADEVVRAHMQGGSTLSKEEEARLRTAVDRTLKPTSPVFILLQKRLFSALVTALVHARMGSHTSPERGTGPSILKSGQDRGRAGKRPRLVLDPEDIDKQFSVRFHPSEANRPVAIKGFEDPALDRAISAVFGRLDEQLRWVEDVWEDVIETKLEK
ncbi:hypothetical protein ID866_4840 [Astraeus odoratus]|nr:hypothetical protein ID866_4840 [Astraeus odoratus]